MRKRVYTTKKNVSNCFKCSIFKAKNSPEGAGIKEESESEEHKDSNEDSESDDQNDDQ